VGEYPDDVLRMVWQLDRVEPDELGYRRLPGTRPWAFWVFDRGEDRPAAEAVRLAELGELSPAELAAFRRRADKARPRIGTPSEHTSGGRSRVGGCPGGGVVGGRERGSVTRLNAVRWVLWTPRPPWRSARHVTIIAHPLRGGVVVYESEAAESFAEEFDS
jgi:hypothetical protein